MFALRFRRASLAWVAVALSTRLAAAQTLAPAPVPLLPAVASPPVASPSGPQPASRDDVAALREEVRLLRAEVEARKASEDVKPAPPPPAAPPPAAPPALGSEQMWPWILPPEGLSVSGFVQAQYETHQDSQDQLNANGQTLNKDRFSIRRARVALTGEWEYAAAVLQLDANTTSGPQVDLRKAEASLQYRPDRTRPPLVMATIGLFDTPFGYETDEPSHTRFFMETTTASSAFFPGQADLGVRFAGALGFFRWTIAAMNGEPIGEASPYVAQDPNSGKDVVARFGFDSHPLPRLQLAGGVSALSGEGFSPGNIATGPSLQWNAPQLGTVQTIGNLTGVAPQSATPSQNFNRWAVGADFRTSFKWALGVTKLYGEFVLAQNLDRGSQYAANPIFTGQNQRELGFYIAAMQEVTRWGVVGLRYDYYDPNSNAFNDRLGMLIPSSEAIRTLSPIVGLVLPDRARLLLQYDIIQNALARNSLGVPTSLADNVLTLRLQVQL